jgi:hypothetical protein
MNDIQSMISDPEFLGFSEQDQLAILRTVFGEQQEVGGEAGPIVPGESISTITGKPIAGGELPQTGTSFDSEKLIRPTLEMGGLTAGAVLGAPAGPGGGVVGGGLGYAGGKKIADIIYDEQDQGLPSQLLQTGKDIATGAAMEAGGQIGGQVIKGIASGVGKVGKNLLGRLTGTGEAAVEEAYRGSPQFKKALTGEITGEEIVSNAKNVLQGIRDNRGADYVAKLDKIKGSSRPLFSVAEGLTNKLKRLMSKDMFDIEIIPSKGGIDFDFSKSTLVEGQPVIKKALTDISTWDDFTAKGLDALKKRISTYTGQMKRGSPQESFLTQIKKTLSEGLKQNVPGYREMTRDYGQITNLIKDIESGLMMRKQGMTGRIVADQTLRRLTSAMKDNFKLRKELVDALSSDGIDVGAQVAGYSMESILPHGIAGTAPSLIGGGALSVFKPEFIPVILASSPRVTASFLQALGKTTPKFKGVSKALSRIGAYEGLKTN